MPPPAATRSSGSCPPTASGAACCTRPRVSTHAERPPRRGLPGMLPSALAHSRPCSHASAERRQAVHVRVSPQLCLPNKCRPRPRTFPLTAIPSPKGSVRGMLTRRLSYSHRIRLPGRHPGKRRQQGRRRWSRSPWPAVSRERRARVRLPLPRPVGPRPVTVATHRSPPRRQQQLTRHPHSSLHCEAGWLHRLQPRATGGQLGSRQTCAATTTRWDRSSSSEVTTTVRPPPSLRHCPRLRLRPLRRLSCGRRAAAERARARLRASRLHNSRSLPHPHSALHAPQPAPWRPRRLVRLLPHLRLITTRRA
mmetsp:Transcript_8100/g.26059  ORF Transcript_8100/g.26059 Transcript_8100/m.26059 type:complete len:308 (+) Transcript_8100:923-1846(+)